MRCCLGLLSLALVACGAPPSPQGPAAVSSRVSSQVRVPPPVPIDARLVRRLARSPGAVAAAVDPEVGVVFVQVFHDVAGGHPHADPDGVVRFGQRLCGPALGGPLERLSKDLALRYAEGDPGTTCDGDACRYPAADEFGLAGLLRFKSAPVGPRLIEVIQIEGGPVTPAFSSAAYAWAAQKSRALAGGRCEP